MSKIRTATAAVAILGLGPFMGSAPTFARSDAARTPGPHAFHARLTLQANAGHGLVRPGYAGPSAVRMPGSVFQLAPRRGSTEACDLPSSACSSGTRIYN